MSVVFRNLETDGCLSNPCLNGATCEFQDGKVSCKCKGEFTGPTCAGT